MPELVCSVVGSALVLSLLPFRPSVEALVLVQAFTLAPLVPVNGWIAKRRFGIRPSFPRDGSAYRRLLAGWFPLGLAALFVMATVRVDQILIYGRLPAAELGK